MEHIVSFLDDGNRTYKEFNIQMTGITYPDPHYYVERKKSGIYCMEYIISGEGTVHVDDEVIYPSKGDVYILPIGHHHRYNSSYHNPWEKIWMNVNGPLCDALFQVYHLEGILWMKDLDLYDLFKKFLSICEQKDLSLHQVLQQSALVFHEILSAISLHLNASPNVKNAAAYLLKEYIDQHIYDKFSIDELSKIACLSSSQLTRVFKKEFSQTPYEYILTQKIRTAKLLLTNTNLSVKQIAYKLNFADEHYFSNSFKARTKVSPIEFKKTNMI
jgi:AraC-like DNA-binding protein